MQAGLEDVKCILAYWFLYHQIHKELQNYPIMFRQKICCTRDVEVKED
jgi:hypothetical protein